MNKASSKSRILIVEDTYSIALTYQNWLNAARFDAAITGSAEEAAERLKSEYFDAMVLDLNLPGMSGKEFLLSGLIPAHCQVVMATSTGSIKTALRDGPSRCRGFFGQAFYQTRINRDIKCANQTSEETL